ncbi:MAG: class I SAM-dependent methyltransferase [Candidatus Micrarchaeia archaeon]
MKRRPENRFSALDFYESGEGVSHVETNAVRRIQRALTLRALQLVMFPIDQKILDAGCGSGYSLDVLNEVGYSAQGFDLSPKLVGLAKAKGLEVKVGDLTDVPFPTASIGGIISISALQWILKGNDTDKKKNVKRAAQEFKRVLRPRGKAVVQFYAESVFDEELVRKVFEKQGFKAELVVDNPQNKRKRKVFLVCSA